MAVDIQGKGSCCVAQVFLDGLHIVIGLERSNCVRVTKSAKAGFGYTRFCHHQFECPVSCLRCDTMPGLIRKYQAGFFVEILITCPVASCFVFSFFRSSTTKRAMVR